MHIYRSLHVVAVSSVTAVVVPVLVSVSSMAQMRYFGVGHR